jgi:protein associated with RNAse G/E
MPPVWVFCGAMPTPLPAGSLIHVISTKYDGSPHRRFDAYRVEPHDEAPGASLRLYVPAGTLIHTATTEDRTTIDYVHLFWPGSQCWWNVEHYPEGFTHPQRGLEFSYANVSLPATLDGDTLRWVDLDLDVIIAAHGVVLKDEDEFAQHIVRFAYPEDLIRRTRDAAGTLLDLASAGAPPFDRETYAQARPTTPPD